MAKRENFRTRRKQDQKEPNGKDVLSEKSGYILPISKLIKF